MLFNHFDEKGQAIMVDVSAKEPTLRTARAAASVKLKSETLDAILEGGISKGDVLGVARLAGIGAAKKTSDLIPLSHPLAIHHVAVEFKTDRLTGTVTIEATVRAFERTGVEMEAMTAAAVAALTVYDMCKGTDKSITIGEICLLYKEGGKSGIYEIQGDPSDCAGAPAIAVKRPAAVSFVAKSGTGKTTLLEKVISELKARSYRVGVIKHDAHKFDIDHPGKDSYRMAAAGADSVLISSPEKLALVKRHDASPPIGQLIATYFADMDIVLTEGFKQDDLLKIEVHRSERSDTLLCRGIHNDPTLIAIASDAALDIDVPLLDLNNAVEVTDFLEQYFFNK